MRANAVEDYIVLYNLEEGRPSWPAPVRWSGAYGVDHTVQIRRWSTPGVTFSDPQFTVYFDGEELLDVEDTTFVGMGNVGLWTMADSVTSVDECEVITP